MTNFVSLTLSSLLKSLLIIYSFILLHLFKRIYDGLRVIAGLVLCGVYLACGVCTYSLLNTVCKLCKTSILCTRILPEFTLELSILHLVVCGVHYISHSSRVCSLWHQAVVGQALYALVLEHLYKSLLSLTRQLTPIKRLHCDVCSVCQSKLTRSM